MYTFSTIKNLQSDLQSGKTTCVSVLNETLKTISERKNLNVFLEVFEAGALEQAKKVDEKITLRQAQGPSAVPLGKLAGVIIALKDNICYKGHKVSASSKILEGFESLYSSTVVERLLEQDAIIIGRTNSDEFAMGSSNENSAFGKVLNPLNEKCVPGGSSGGANPSVIV